MLSPCNKFEWTTKFKWLAYKAGQADKVNTMCRKDLLNNISTTLENCGLIESSLQKSMTYQRNIKYPSIFSDKSDHAHFVVYLPERTIQIVAKYQESHGTAIEKLAYTAMDAARTSYDDYLVICAGTELLKHSRAINFLNLSKGDAPKLSAITLEELANILEPYLPKAVA